ncbi:MAG: CDP-alcohol phosphatidyltransferase family protein [Bacteroidaceae bacterium]|nr:CDP-alcohol phosphatidyltransferase family protein [Bacteroidaceae bacterium]
MRLTDRVRKTQKSRDTEGPFELYVTRTPGYLWAVAFERLGVHPVAVTLMSIVIGAASGWFFYSTDVRVNAIGMLLLVWANWYDCADGQLARMTGKRTMVGRILDGFAGDVWFFFIYLFLCLRLQQEWGWGVWLLGAWSGLHCHCRQCAIGDYYRNVHMYFELGRERAELDESPVLQKQYDALRWSREEWFRKLYLFFYIRYTRGQEAQAPAVVRMKRSLEQWFPAGVPAGLREEFCRRSRPLMPLTNILTFDTRVIVLFVSTAMGHPWVYFVFEATILEAVRYYMIRRHNVLCEDLMTKAAVLK